MTLLSVTVSKGVSSDRPNKTSGRVDHSLPSLKEVIQN